MSFKYLESHRHCLHIMATHYPESGWADRGAIFNQVFSTSLHPDKVRDEYGGHKQGKRIQPNGIKPTRALMWNDEVCRDEFNLPGPYNQQQQQTRQTILQRIQAAITALGLSRNHGLMAINMIPGRVRADNNATAGPAAVVPPVANPPPAAPASAATTLPGQGAAYSAAAAGTTSGTTPINPALGERPYYHTQEIVKIGDRYAYRPVAGLAYPAPTITWRRPVDFTPTLTVSVQVCDMSSCMVCRRERPIRGG